MVRVSKDYNAPPAALLDEKWTDLKALPFQANYQGKADTRCYRDTTIDALILLYHDKCAYCERKRGIELEVDHYRAKKPRDNKTNPEDNHPGYYWLWYEWSNLIPACSKCNSKKSTLFPVAGIRVTSHRGADGHEDANTYSADWLHGQEQPLLLNPEIDTELERHFRFLNNGSVQHRSPHGEQTIRVCQLNRIQLRRERLKILKDLADQIEDSFGTYQNNQSANELRAGLRTTFRLITKGTDPTHAFSLYYRYIYNYFPYYVGSNLPAAIRAVATKYFEAYKLNG